MHPFLVIYFAYWNFLSYIPNISINFFFRIIFFPMHWHCYTASTISCIVNRDTRANFRGQYSTSMLQRPLELNTHPADWYFVICLFIYLMKQPKKFCLFMKVVLDVYLYCDVNIIVSKIRSKFCLLLNSFIYFAEAESSNAYQRFIEINKIMQRRGFYLLPLLSRFVPIGKLKDSPSLD